MILHALRVAAALALLLAAGGALPAEAQEGTEGGFKVGNARVRPQLDVGWGIDSAAGYFPSSPYAASNKLAPEWVARIRPGAQATLPTSIADLSGGVALDLVWLTGLLSPGSSSASRLLGDLNLAARFNPRGPFGFQVEERLVRSDRTSNPGAGLGLVSFRNDVRLSAPMKPGGGALELTPAVAYGLELFSPIVNRDIDSCAGDAVCQASAVSQSNFHNLRAELMGSYRFLPRTSLLLDSSFDARSYFYASGNPGAMMLRAGAGVAGMLLPKVAGLVKVGYARNFVGTANTVIGQLEATYLFNTRSSVQVGYLRSVEPIPTYGTMGDDRAYVGASYALGEKIRVHGNLAFDYLTFGSARTDLVFAASPSADYQVTRWFRASLSYAFTARTSNASTVSTLNMLRHDAQVRASFAW
jgi:hypothetical protein